jgi:hypothetical protein
VCIICIARERERGAQAVQGEGTLALGLVDRFS